jgi:N-acyl-D-amino-acid deacylase
MCLGQALCLSLVFWPQFSRGRGAGHPAATPLQARTVPSAQGQAVDLLFEGGTIVDGSGASPTRADLGIRDDRIAFIGHARKARLRAARIIDVKGLIVAPGFIDPHTHAGADLSDPLRKNNLNYLMQGVTTVIVGNDGGGSPEVAKVLRQWEEQGIGTNVGVLVGHGAVRRQVLGSGDVQPTAEQLEQMKALVRKAMGEGALGLSTGLFYVPGAFAKTEEVIELAKVAAGQGGVYDSHMRDEDSYSIGLLGSIVETIRIGREAKIPVHISHIKALGPEVWGQSAEAIASIRKARAEGIDVTADQYPYIASESNLVASLMPHWAEALPREKLLALFDDAGQRPRLLKEVGENLARRGGPESLLFTSAQAPELRGRTLGALAKQRNESPAETALEMIRQYTQSNATGALAVASFNMREDDLERFMRQDFVMTGSDGSRGHPRLYGTYPRKLRVFVYQKRLLTLPFAIHASSTFPAETLHLADRGLLRRGYYADVIAFDPATIADRATYEDPEILARGMKYVIVNGKVVIDDGKFTGILAGCALRRR